MKVRQVELYQPLGTTRRLQVVWVDATLPIHPGNVVRGKDGEEWMVLKVYTQVIEHTAIHDDWRVGGLGP